MANERRGAAQSWIDSTAMGPVLCACGALLATDDTIPPAVCPQCGSVTNPITGVEAKGRIADHLRVELIDYSEVLLGEAADLMTRGQYGVAVVVAHVACEVTVQAALTRAFNRRNIGYLEKAIMGRSGPFSSGFNLGNERLQILYTALTDDDITQQPFWTQFTASARRRHRYVHAGTNPPEAEARESLQIATAFVNHMKRQG